MEQDKLLASLCTLVKRLEKLSPELKLVAVSVQNGPGLQIYQWKGILETFVKAIDGKIYEKTLQSKCNEWLAGVKVLAADVEEILDEIAGNKTLEESSKKSFPFCTRRKNEVVPTVNDGLRNKIFHTSSQLAALNDKRHGIGLQVSNKSVPSSRPELGNKSAGLPNSGAIYGRDFTDQTNPGNLSMVEICVF